MWFLWNRSSYTFTSCTIMIGLPKNFRMHCVWPSKYKGKMMFLPTMWFLTNKSSCSFEICTIAIGTPENFGVHWVWPSKYKGKWCFSPKCVSSETNHHTALKFVPLQLAHLKTSGCTELGPLNTMVSDLLAQNVVSLKQVIIHLYFLYHYDWLA